MLLLRRPTPERLAGVVADMDAAAFTYDEVGATRAAAFAEGAGAALPAGYRHVRETAALGEGQAAFDRAVDALRSWRTFRSQGFVVAPGDPPLVEGTVVVSAIPVPPAWALASCRIVWAVDEADRFGFGYGTLPAHPARGEEAFVVERSPGGRVEGRITAFSLPRHPLARAAGPIAVRQQARATRGYLTAMAAPAPG